MNKLQLVARRAKARKDKKVTVFKGFLLGVADSRKLSVVAASTRITVSALIRQIVEEAIDGMDDTLVIRDDGTVQKK